MLRDLERGGRTVPWSNPSMSLLANRRLWDPSKEPGGYSTDGYPLMLGHAAVVMENQPHRLPAPPRLA